MRLRVVAEETNGSQKPSGNEISSVKCDLGETTAAAVVSVTLSPAASSLSYPNTSMDSSHAQSPLSLGFFKTPLQTI
ncbi:hypothetical protein V6N13_040224 [Hibiscus sabdariffa]